MLKKKKLGPGILITSAFIGPGTVTMCLLAGVTTGHELLWAVIFSTVATVVLQDMCVRFGYYSKHGLEEQIHHNNLHPIAKWVAFIYIFCAIIVGNTAYQSGNISGASMGLNLVYELETRWPYFIGIFLICAACFLIGSFDLIKKILGFLVFIMCLAFIAIAVYNFPNFISVIEGSLLPRFKTDNLFIIIGVIGTTVVPYNLFLHTALVSNSDLDIKTLRRDSMLAILIGGAISYAIIIIGSLGRGMQIETAHDMAKVLESSVGSTSKYLLGFGLFAAGLSSALTAPMAAALVMSGLFKWKKDFKSPNLKIAQLAILTIGFLVAYTQTNNLKVIKLAQFINGILLPVFAIYLFYLLNNRDIVKVHKNTILQNILGALVILVTLLLAVKSIMQFI